ncbi:MAG TPA: hypothetical protein VFH70_00165 [Acidimicrobiales bacterium]|nr:hypothetical protein [Acidimicrobiales bacterium]
MAPPDVSAPDVIVTWLQNDYGQLGRPAESIAHALQDSGLARQVAYIEPRIPTDGPPSLDIESVRGVHRYVLRGAVAEPSEVAAAVTANSQLRDPVLLNFGVDIPNWWFHHTFAPVASTTALVTHDVLELWPGQDPARSAHLKQVRRLLVRSSDQVIGLSTGSIDDVAGAVYVGHGCDPGMDDPAIDSLPEPPDLAAIPHPRALYFGALSYRIDVAAVAALADSGVHVVLVGFAPSPALAELIQRHRRVHFLGARPPGASRPYLLHCDLGIVPHTDEPFTWTMEPHKVYNYSCAGVRSVLLNCTPPRDLAHLLGSARTVDGFVEACRAQLANGRLTDGERDEARRHTWTSVAGRILTAVGHPVHETAGVS